MDRVEVETLVETMRRVVMSYATEGYNAAGERDKLHFVENPQEQVFAVLASYNAVSKHANVVLMARIIDGRVVIQEDKTSVSLIDELEKTGIPISQIAFA